MSYYKHEQNDRFPTLKISAEHMLANFVAREFSAKQALLGNMWDLSHQQPVDLWINSDSSLSIKNWNQKMGGIDPTEHTENLVCIPLAWEFWRSGHRDVSK